MLSAGMLRRRRRDGGSGPLVFRYQAGDPVSGASTATRSTVGRYIDVNGLLQSASSGVIRTSHYPNMGATQTMLIEAVATNAALWSRDLTNAAWTKTSCTATLNQTGIDGAANTASSLTATGANATCLQAITATSTTRVFSAWVKRLTGSGTIQMTLDGGTTWTTVTVTASWQQLQVPKQTLANPSVGFKIVTSGDAIAIDGAQCENQSTATSPIITTSATAQRQNDNVAWPFTLVPQAMSVYLRFIEIGSRNMGAVRLVHIGDSNVSTLRFDVSGTGASGYTINYTQGGTTVTTNLGAPSLPALGDDVELLATLNADTTATLTQLVNGSTQTQVTSSALAYPATWGSAPEIGPGTGSSGSQNVIAVRKLAVATGVQTMAFMRGI